MGTMDRITKTLDNGTVVLVKGDTPENLQEALCVLADYEEKENDGLLARFPFAFGQTLWYALKGAAKVREMRVNAITLTDTNEVYEIELEEVADGRFTEKYIGAGMEEIGKIYFLTHEEAEAALTRMEGRDDTVSSLCKGRR
jgi:hypothetical protein